ncbi:hypothetical protein K469DRAFT_718189 [Zopfia rhizophila CBS 207.26]|uniref:R3H domain-containing protein n=1 Tax=Zopfia rhizophila CBS 207.26 TaxID=1314779 RepID=A0A6A6DHP2_9PEZI|nr:hypothetical protein K469DRAFT_718189 [Zopfia rhizophila CBS 207.26]
MSAPVPTPQPIEQIPTGPSSGNQRRRRPPQRNRHANPPPEIDDDPAQESQRGSKGGRGRRQHAGSNERGPDAQQERGGRSGRGRGQLTGRNGGTTQQPQPDEPLNAHNPAPEQAHLRRVHRGRGGATQGQPARMAHGGRRQFGGLLTVDNENSASVGSHMSGLQAHAPEFHPSQPILPRNPRPRPPREQKRRASKSSAPDIATRTHEDIDNGHYECAICTEELRRSSRAWSCRTCWTVFHLGCVKKWSTNEGSAAARQQAQDAPRQWRCPGCNLPQDVFPKTFSCWCGKEVDPKPLSGLPPYSCGQTCSRARTLPKKCPHPCPATCHAGPCPPCSQMGPTQSCFCGNKSITRRCSDTDYDKGWSCGDVCGHPMPCGEHRCPRPCHDGLCGVCEVRIPSRCYCGQIEKDILCCHRGDSKESSQSHTTADGLMTVERWVGLFVCSNMCGREFDCGKHHCEKPCHKQDTETPHCPLSPDTVSHCPCGKSPLLEISDRVRKTCEDPIPNCLKPCGKILECRHECLQLCHQGECMPCLRLVSIACRCGRTNSSTVCHQGAEELPQCMRVCRTSLNCGRHECGERCCPGERKASERQSNMRKLRPLHSASRPFDDGFEAEHICTRSCGRQLKCGNSNHRCQELCHKGACGTCREAIFEEVGCHCGRTVLQPPLPCGTEPPPCQFQCERPKACGHPQVAHSCHQDEESCPKCPFLTTKLCLCGKQSLKNQPCWLNEVRCGNVCGRRLKCGAHKCQKQCHRPGECEEPCRQPCGKDLDVCGHPCMAPCHSPFPCKGDQPCQHKIFVNCECQRIKKEAKCNASEHSDGNLKKTLKCDNDCARLERNRKLAMALNIDTDTHQNNHIPYSAATLNMYQENSTWAAAQEKELRLFAANPAEKRLRFRPMRADQRAFLHSIAKDFGFDSHSMDPEPHRHVAIFKTPRFVMAPTKTLTECARIQ